MTPALCYSRRSIIFSWFDLFGGFPMKRLRYSLIESRQAAAVVSTLITAILLIDIPIFLDMLIS